MGNSLIFNKIGVFNVPEFHLKVGKRVTDELLNYTNA